MAKGKGIAVNQGGELFNLSGESLLPRGNFTLGQEKGGKRGKEKKLQQRRFIGQEASPDSTPPRSRLVKTRVFSNVQRGKKPKTCLEKTHPFASNTSQKEVKGDHVSPA